MVRHIRETCSSDTVDAWKSSLATASPSVREFEPLQKQSLDQRDPDLRASTERDCGYPFVGCLLWILHGWSGHGGIAPAPPSPALLSMGSRDVRMSTRRTKEKVTAALVPSVEVWVVTVPFGTQETPVILKAVLLAASTSESEVE